MTATTPDLPAMSPSPEAADRDRLAEASAGLSRPGWLRAASGRWFELAGLVLAPLGLAFILLAWYGTAHTTRTWKQVPYVVSGGLLGLSLVFVGGFCYFAYWISQTVEEDRRQATEDRILSERTLRSLERIEHLLGQGFGVRSSSDVLVVVGDASLVHRPSCPMLVGKNDVRPVDGDEAAELRPCPVCSPDVKVETNGRRRAATRGRRKS